MSILVWAARSPSTPFFWTFPGTPWPTSDQRSSKTPTARRKLTIVRAARRAYPVANDRQPTPKRLDAGFSESRESDIICKRQQNMCKRQQNVRFPTHCGHELLVLRITGYAE
jgi:hypothetical protein